MVCECFHDTCFVWRWDKILTNKYSFVSHPWHRMSLLTWMTTIQGNNFHIYLNIMPIFLSWFSLHKINVLKKLLALIGAFPCHVSSPLFNVIFFLSSSDKPGNAFGPVAEGWGISRNREVTSIYKPQTPEPSCR